MADSTNITVKFLNGERGKIDSKITDGTIDAGDVIFTSDTEEVVFISPTNVKTPIQSRTQTDVTMHGTGVGALTTGSVVPAGTNLKEFIEMLDGTYKDASVPTITISKNAADIATGYVQIGTQHTINLHIATDNHIAQANVHINDNVLPVTLTAGIGNTQFNLNMDGEKAVYATVDYTNKLGEKSTAKSNELVWIPGYPIYGGTEGVLTGTLTPELVKQFPVIQIVADKGQKITFDIEFPKGQQTVMFAYPKSFGEVDQVMQVEMGTDMTSKFLRTEEAIDGVQYYVYIYEAKIALPATTTFVVTV